MNSFLVNQRVVFLREPGGGRIIAALSKGVYQVEDEDGFSRKMQASELAPVHGENYEIPDPIEIQREKEAPLKRVKSRAKSEPQCWEIDLHIEELVDSHFGWSNADILLHQMSAFREFCRKARSKRVKKVVVIHGVGEGVLRHEVRQWLNQQDGLRYENADFREYGQGATMIEFFYS